MLPQEQVFYQDLTVKISRTQAVFEDATYPMSRISEAKALTILPRGMTEGGCLFMLVGLILLLLFYLTNYSLLFAYLIGSLVVVEVVVVTVLVVIYWKPVYYLKITTTFGGEFIAVRSKDASSIKLIAKAINRAKTSRD